MPSCDLFLARTFFSLVSFSDATLTMLKKWRTFLIFSQLIHFLYVVNILIFQSKLGVFFYGFIMVDGLHTNDIIFRCLSVVNIFVFDFEEARAYVRELRCAYLSGGVPLLVVNCYLSYLLGLGSGLFISE